MIWKKGNVSFIIYSNIYYITNSILHVFSYVYYSRYDFISILIWRDNEEAIIL